MKFKKVAALALIGAMTVTALASCGGDKNNAGDNSNESKSIRVFFGDGKGTDNDEVSNAVSKLSEEKIGVKVEMVFFGWGEYAQKMPKLLATNEQMDIGFDSGDSFVTYARDGAYYDISKDLEAYPALKKLFTDEFLGGVTIDGGIYGIPTLKEMAEVWAVYLDQEVIDNNNLDMSGVKTIYDMESVLAALKKDGRQGFRIAEKGEHVAFDKLLKYDTISGPFVISNDENVKASSKKVVNYFETEDFENYVRLLRDWYNKGYISSDVLENGASTYDNIVSGDKSKNGLRYLSYAPLMEISESKARGRKTIPVLLTEPTISNASTRGSIYAIFNKSENKQSSLKFLQLWNTDKEMNTLIKYGIEGKHYNFIEEDGVKKVKKVDGVGNMYTCQNWKSGNVLISQLTEGEPANKYEEYEKFNKEARTSCVLGFTPNLANFEAELSACNTVVNGKVAALLTGAVDPDDPEYGVEAIRKDMKKAGSDKVVTEIQKQYLKWLKEK